MIVSLIQFQKMNLNEANSGFRFGFLQLKTSAKTDANALWMGLKFGQELGRSDSYSVIVGPCWHFHWT